MHLSDRAFVLDMLHLHPLMFWFSVFLLKIFLNTPFQNICAKRNHVKYESVSCFDVWTLIYECSKKTFFLCAHILFAGLEESITVQHYWKLQTIVQYWVLTNVCVGILPYTTTWSRKWGMLCWDDQQLHHPAPPPRWSQSQPQWRIQRSKFG